MTIAELATVTEHAATLEADGLSRKDAIMAAFKRFPEAFRKCRELVEKGRGGEDELYSFLEFVIEKGPQSAPGGPQLNAETKQAETRGKAPEKQPRAIIKTGLEGLKNYVKRERA